MMWRSMIYGLVMWVVTIYAFRRGGWPERGAAIGILVASYLSVLVVSGSDDDLFRKVEVPMATVDTVLLMVLGGIAMFSARFWPLWLAAMQGMVVLAHLSPLIPQIAPYATWRAVALWSWPMWAILAYAVYAHSHRKPA